MKYYGYFDKYDSFIQKNINFFEFFVENGMDVFKAKPVVLYKLLPWLKKFVVEKWIRS